jgi:acyl-CoA synthetase (AMP-forming)/AMP-acid ligase II
MRIAAGGLGPITDLVAGTRWTGAELDREIARRGAELSRRGVGPGRHAVIAHGGTPGFFADLFAVWHAGGCAVCTDPGLTPGELDTIAEFVAARLVLAGPRDIAAPDCGVPVLTEADYDTGDEPAQPLSAVAALDDPALILFTSGTTGRPKGVVHSFRSLAARIALNQAHIGLAILENTLCVLPTHFGHGLIGNCLTPLMAGRHLCLMPGIGMRGAAQLGTVLADNGISFMSSVPALWKLVLKTAAPPDRRTLRQVHVGSAPLAVDLWQDVARWCGTDRVFNMYGITETANWLAGASLMDIGADPGAGDGLLGTMWGGTAAIVDPAGGLGRDGEGEIIVHSPALMQGYYKRPDLTEQVLRDGWFLTGDVGRIDDAGRLWLTGRRKNEINRAGMKVHPEEIDLLLERHDAVLEACAFGVPDDISGEIVGVAVKLTDGAAVDTTALRAWCRERLRRECVPEKWFVVPEIPKTDRGKVNRQTVLDYCLDRRDREG